MPVACLRVIRGHYTRPRCSVIDPKPESNGAVRRQARRTELKIRLTVINELKPFRNGPSLNRRRDRKLESVGTEDGKRTLRDEPSVSYAHKYI